MQHRISQFLVLIPLVLFSTSGHSQAEVWDLWKQPGVHAIMRHASAPGFGDPEGFTLGNCKTQRNLSTAGREEARALGKAIRSQGVQLTAIFSSQWCRCLDTAQELNLGKVQALPALNSFFQGRGSSADQTTALKEHFATLQPGDKVLYVTHQVNTTALTGVYPDSGEVVLFRSSPTGEITVIGRLPSP